MMSRVKQDHARVVEGEVATCGRCSRQIVLGPNSIWVHDRFISDHTPEFLVPDFQEIGPPRICRCGTMFNMTDIGEVHEARSSAWQRSCRYGTTPSEDPKTVVAARRYPCIHCGRPAFANDRGENVQHVEAHPDHDAASCIDIEGHKTGTIATIADPSAADLFTVTDTTETETSVDTLELEPDTLWRNNCGSVMHVIMPAYGDMKTLGDIWIARPQNALHSERWLVTPEGMQEAGYVQVSA